MPGFVGIELLRAASGDAGLLRDLRTRDQSRRNFDPRDDLQFEPVALVSESLARGFFGSPEDAVGRGVKLVEQGPDAPWTRIVGVVPDAIVDSGIPARQTGFLPSIEIQGNASRAAVFPPLSQSTSTWLSVVAKTSSTPQQSVLSLRQALHGIDPRVPLFWETT